MKKNRKPNILLFLILLIISVLTYVSFNFIFELASNKLIEERIEGSKQEAMLIANLLNQKLKGGYTKEEVKNELQKSIENSSTDISFICMFNKEGKEICHPSKKIVNTFIDNFNSTISSFSNLEITENFKKVLANGKPYGGIRSVTKKNYSEIVYIVPVENTDWLVASHANMVSLKETMKSLKNQLILIFVIVWLISALLFFVFGKFLYDQYQKEISSNNEIIAQKYFNYLKEIKLKMEMPTVPLTDIQKEEFPKRLLASKGNKLSPILIEDIAMIYTQNKVTYIIDKNNIKKTINLALDELMKMLNPNFFYRVSRQVIISINSVEKVEKYGNTQLKIFTNPVIEDQDIIVSKAKLTDFKKWLGQLG